MGKEQRLCLGLGGRVVEGFEMSDLRPQGYYNLPSFKFVSPFSADGAVTTREARER